MSVREFVLKKRINQNDHCLRCVESTSLSFQAGWDGINTAVDKENPMTTRKGSGMPPRLIRSKRN